MPLFHSSELRFIRFKDYRINENDKLVLQKMHYIIPPNNERNYLEELLKKLD